MVIISHTLIAVYVNFDNGKYSKIFGVEYIPKEIKCLEVKACYIILIYFLLANRKKTIKTILKFLNN